MTAQEQLDKLTESVGKALADSYETGYSHASNEILAEVLNALTERQKTSRDTVGLDTAIAIVKGFQE
jgi:hypothetical protein